jgi:fatty acid desaturase
MPFCTLMEGVWWSGKSVWVMFVLAIIGLVLIIITPFGFLYFKHRLERSQREYEEALRRSRRISGNPMARFLHPAYGALEAVWDAVKGLMNRPLFR